MQFEAIHRRYRKRQRDIWFANVLSGAILVAPLLMLFMVLGENAVTFVLWTVPVLLPVAYWARQRYHPEGRGKSSLLDENDLYATRPKPQPGVPPGYANAPADASNPTPGTSQAVGQPQPPEAGTTATGTVLMPAVDARKTKPGK